MSFNLAGERHSFLFRQIILQISHTRRRGICLLLSIPVLPCRCSWTEVASTQIMCRCAHTVLLPTLSQLCSGGNLIPQLSPLLEIVLLFIALECLQAFFTATDQETSPGTFLLFFVTINCLFLDRESFLE